MPSWGGSVSDSPLATQERGHIVGESDAATLLMAPFRPSLRSRALPITLGTVAIACLAASRAILPRWALTLDRRIPPFAVRRKPRGVGERLISHSRRDFALRPPRPVVTLARLIELKLACGLSNMRRAYRDLADVVELIAVNQLGRDFARFLPKSLRKEFRALVQRARSE